MSLVVVKFDRHRGLITTDQADFKGGIVYIRARQITVRSGGKIHANGGDPSIGQYDRRYNNGYGGYVGAQNRIRSWGFLL